MSVKCESSVLSALNFKVGFPCIKFRLHFHIFLNILWVFPCCNKAIRPYRTSLTTTKTAGKENTALSGIVKPVSSRDPQFLKAFTKVSIFGVKNVMSLNKFTYVFFIFGGKSVMSLNKFTYIFYIFGGKSVMSLNKLTYIFYIFVIRQLFRDLEKISTRKMLSILATAISNLLIVNFSIYQDGLNRK